MFKPKKIPKGLIEQLGGQWSVDCSFCKGTIPNHFICEVITKYKVPDRNNPFSFEVQYIHKECALKLAEKQYARYFSN